MGWIRKIFVVFTILFTFIFNQLYSQKVKSNICLGAYYFDGWTGKTSGPISKRLVNDFSEREPVWGWVTSTPKIMEEQINLASDAGIGFFNFCWYYPNDTIHDYLTLPLNHALGLYLKSSNKSKLKFSLLIANHAGFAIGPKDWDSVSNAWLRLFRDRQYLKVNDKPYITIFDLKSLINSFVSTDSVKTALNKLRLNARQVGFKGVTFAVTIDISDPGSALAAKLCGFDIITGYNYPGAGSGQAINNQIYLSKLREGEKLIWDRLKNSSLPYIPVTTLNWDPRPWKADEKDFQNTLYYSGYSKESVFQSIVQLRKWMRENISFIPKEKIAMVYAWNEYGEGGWLTPSKYKDKGLLAGLKAGMHFAF